MKHDEFSVIQTLVTLARSGNYRKKEPLFDKMYELFPQLTEKQLHKAVGQAFGNTYPTRRGNGKND